MPGSTVNVALTPGFSGSVYTEYWRIWIDYNDDHDFEDPGEEVFSGVGSAAVTGIFTVAPGAMGITRMRVSMKYAGYPTPCETFTYGEVEDYSLFLGGEQWSPHADFTYTINGLTANFTDTSTDIDGTIVGWNWDFGDGNTSTLQHPTHTYVVDGTYSVTLTVIDNDGLTGDISKNVTTGEGCGYEIYVNDITQTITKKGRHCTSNAVVTIWDTCGKPVSDAMVYVAWSGVVSGSDSGITGPDGTVTFESDGVKSTGPFIITVANVTHATRTYNPALNKETSDTAAY
jgi:PKD repeat protein